MQARVSALLRARQCLTQLPRADHLRRLPKVIKQCRRNYGSMLDRYGRDLTAAAASSGPVFGRDDEIDRVVSILSRKSKNSAVLVGAAGVGKTAIAEGLAQRLARGQVPGALAGARVVELNVPKVIAGTKYIGTLETRVTGVIAEAEAAAAHNQPVVLFVDEIHMLLGAGITERSNMDVSNMLKPALGRGRLRCLGATTDDEYHRIFASDAAFERRFQKVHVPEPSEDATIAILRGLKPSFEEHHGTKIQDDALVAAVKLAARYVTARYFPDKAIDLVDEACAAARLQMERRRRQQAGRSGMPDIYEIIGPEHVAQIVSKWTGIPVTTLGQDERKRLLDLPERLHRRVVGQDEAVAAVADAVLRSRSGLANPYQPAGSFLFLGPTGVGKTELAKALAEELFGSEKALVRIDMSEHVDTSCVSGLIGAPPGTVGYEEGGRLTEPVMRRPYSVVLFDEVEKGGAAAFNLFLQILDDGRLTDGKGRTVDFTNTIIIMTSNLGEHELRMHFRPELINRLDEMVVFHPLSSSGDLLRMVARLQLAGVAERLASKGVELDVTDAALDVMLAQTSDQVKVYGARPIRRFVQKVVMTRISRMMVQEEVSEDCVVTIDADEEMEELVFSVKKLPAKMNKSNNEPVLPPGYEAEWAEYEQQQFFTTEMPANVDTTEEAVVLKHLGEGTKEEAKEPPVVFTAENTSADERTKDEQVSFTVEIVLANEEEPVIKPVDKDTEEAVTAQKGPASPAVWMGQVERHTRYRPSPRVNTTHGYLIDASRRLPFNL
ncbi:unnamed protein product [Urochloa humidicola]